MEAGGSAEIISFLWKKYGFFHKKMRNMKKFD